MENLSSFSRTRYNEEKMGAYYTDLSHCRDIHRLLRFPHGKEVCVLEPSIGDGAAVITVTGAADNPGIKIFGVELADSVAVETARNPLIKEVLKADFTDGVMIRKSAFSFCFGNPPYLDGVTETGGKKRTEVAFLEKVTNYLAVGGVCVWVIPYRIFAEMHYMRMWCSSYDTLALYKFREPEYSRWHQVVVIGRKVQRRPAMLQAELAAFMERWSIAAPPELPSDGEAFIDIYPSYEAGVDLFTTRVFDSAAAYDVLRRGIPQNILDAVGRGITQKCEEGRVLNSPPIALKKDHLYLLATAGFSDGVVGSIEGGDLHMLRGCAGVVDHVQASGEDEENGAEKGTVSVITSTEVELRVLENDGTITLLS